MNNTEYDRDNRKFGPVLITRTSQDRIMRDYFVHIAWCPEDNIGDNKRPRKGASLVRPAWNIRAHAYERYRATKFNDAADIVLLEIIWRELRHVGLRESACTTMTRRIRQAREPEGVCEKGSRKEREWKWKGPVCKVRHDQVSAFNITVLHYSPYFSFLLSPPSPSSRYLSFLLFLPLFLFFPFFLAYLLQFNYMWSHFRRKQLCFFSSSRAALWSIIRDSILALREIPLQRRKVSRFSM